ncbi:MAG: tyrosine-type recombinase/integrase [Methanomassiliicoccus sp.]|nr:tyrosine-type recombinase/integrase [Methanomassiliicoccus sp.]
MLENPLEKTKVTNSEEDEELREDLKEEEEEEGERVRGGLVLPKILTYDEQDRFLLAVDDIEDLIACRIMLYAGLRVNEATNVLVKDIDPNQRSVFVRQGKFSKDRYAPIDVSTIALIQCYIAEEKLKPDNKLFKCSKRTLQRHVTEVIAPRAGLSMNTHMLRHTCATWQLDKGIPLEVVKNNLGHASIEVTQIYLHLNIRQRSRIYSDCTRFGI